MLNFGGCKSWIHMEAFFESPSVCFGRNSNSWIMEKKHWMNMELQHNFPSPLFWMTSFRKFASNPNYKTHDKLTVGIFDVFHFWGPNFEIQDFSSVFLGHGESSWVFHSTTIKKLIRPYKDWKKPYSPGWKRRSRGKFRWLVMIVRPLSFF